MAEPTENRGETRRILGEMRSKIMHTQGPDGVHSVQYSTIGITNEADLIAATRRVQEHGEELIRQHREQIASIDDVTDSLAPDDHHRMLALLKAEEKEQQNPAQTILQHFKHWKFKEAHYKQNSPDCKINKPTCSKNYPIFIAALTTYGTN